MFRIRIARYAMHPWRSLVLTALVLYFDSTYRPMSCSLPPCPLLNLVQNTSVQVQFHPFQNLIAYFASKVSPQAVVYPSSRCSPSLLSKSRLQNRLSFMSIPSEHASSDGTWSTYQSTDTYSQHGMGPSSHILSNGPTSPLYPTEPSTETLIPEEGDESSISISMSSTFFAGAGHDPCPTDVILVTTDNVYFYVHSSRLLQHSNNSFGGLLADLSTPLSIAETSEVANLAFHALYGVDPSSYVPDLSLLLRAFNMLNLYGIEPSSVLFPNGPFYSAVVDLGTKFPLQTYSLAAKFGLEVLAMEVSKHLLTIPLHAITDDIAQAMGATYLRRLVFLHLGRIERLKELMMQLPTAHELSTDCSENDQKRLQQEWRALALALSWGADPAMTSSQLYQSFFPLTQKKNLCPKCVAVSCRLLPSLFHG